jgi:hypothetical protein
MKINMFNKNAGSNNLPYFSPFSGSAMEYEERKSHMKWIRCAYLAITVILVNMMMVPPAWAKDPKPVRILFIGNSFTGHHDIPFLFKQLGENGQPGVEIDYIRALHGGKRLRDHWERYGSQIYLKLPEHTAKELETECAQMADALAKAGKNAPPYRQRIANYQIWIEWIEKTGGTPKLDYVVLQSHRDEEGGLESLYAQFARKFAKDIKEHGAKPILYFTEFHGLNAKPLTVPPDPGPITEKLPYQVALANELEALVVPMPLAVLKVLQKRPDLTMRYTDNAHLNQICAYLVTCCFYSAIFGESPVGLTMREINNPGFKNRVDPDGNPKNVVFPEALATVLQESAWEAVSEMNAMLEHPGVMQP